MTVQAKSAKSGIHQKKPFLFFVFTGTLLCIYHVHLSIILPAEQRIFCFCGAGIGIFSLIAGLAGMFSEVSNYKISHFFEKSGNYFGLSPLQFVSLGFAVLFGLTCTLAAGIRMFLVNPVIALSSWLIAIGLLVYSGWERKPVPFSIHRRLFLVVTGFFLLAFLLRGLNLTIYPNNLSGDEASSGLSSTFFLRGMTDNIFITGWYSFPNLHYFIQSFGIAILGQTTTGLRITAALAGSLTVAVLFLIVRSMFNVRTALIASFLLAFSHFHIHFSRIGLNNIWDGLTYPVTLGALWWAWNHERRAAYVLAGLCLGLSQYFYVSSRGLFAAVPLWLAIAALLDRARFRRAIPNLLLMTFTAFVVFLPLAWFYINRPGEFQAPMLRVTILGKWLATTAVQSGRSPFQVLVEQFLLSLQGFTITPLRHAWYRPGTPILRPVLAVLFYLGSILLIPKWKDNRLWLLVVWLMLIVTSGALSTDTPAAQRYVASVPALAAIIGFGIDRMLTWLEERFTAHRKGIAVVILMAVCVAGLDDARFYFYDYSPTVNFGGYPTEVAQRMANKLQKYDSSWEVFFSGWPRMGYRSILTSVYLVPHIDVKDLKASWGDPANPVPEGKKLLYFFLPPHRDDLNACMEQYPGGVMTTEHGFSQTLFYQYEVVRP